MQCMCANQNFFSRNENRMKPKSSV
jgi:hypothetical protein